MSKFAADAVHLKNARLRVWSADFEVSDIGHQQMAEETPLLGVRVRGSGSGTDTQTTVSDWCAFV